MIALLRPDAPLSTYPRRSPQVSQERKVYDTLLAAGAAFTYSDYFERVLWLSQFHRALHALKNRFEVEIEEAPERNVHGFKEYRLKQNN